MFSIVPVLANEQRNHVRLINKHLRDTTNPFKIPDERFRVLYRMPAPLALELLDEIKPFIRTESDIPSHIQMLAALSFYGSGCYQNRVGAMESLNISQSVVSNCITLISELIVKHLAPKYVNFPKTPLEIQEKKNEFLASTGFPDIIGLIDCTHIAIAALPIETEYAFVNRKGFHSVNVQIICDNNLIIQNANARYPGSTPDVYIWRNDYTLIFLEDLYNQDPIANNWLLGDSGYSLQPWLMTPIRTATNTAEERYNRLHAQTRKKVERCIGRLKTTFKCLSGKKKLRYSHKKVASIIYACCTLHNFLIKKKYVATIIEDENLLAVPTKDAADRNPFFHAGFRKRSALVKRL